VEILTKWDAEALVDTHPDTHFEKFEERNASLEPEPEAYGRLISRSVMLS